MLIVAQVLRILSAFFEIMADASSDKKKIFFLNGIYNLLAAISYFILNAFTGGIGCLAAILRNVIFYKFKEKLSVIVLFIFLAFTFCLTLIDFKAMIDIIPFILVGLYTTSLFLGNVKFIKWAVIITCILEIPYDFIYASYAGVLVCTVDIIIVTISMIKDKKKESK